MIHYRGFRNDDPPQLAEVWNETFCSRGAVRLRHSNPLERHVFAKPYFDPAGLILAIEEERCVGFAHAGFGPHPDGSQLSKETGVLCAIGVRPTHRRRGIGTELLQRCEQYLTSQGARTLLAGQMGNVSPFYFGLYGGSEMPGFLDSDADAKPFLESRGYQLLDVCRVYQRRLDEALGIVDVRFSNLRRCYDVRILPRVQVATWWQDCVWGLMEPVEFRMEDKSSGLPVARALAWEMEGFSWRWNQPAVGLMNLEVQEDLRRQGLAKFLLSQILRYLQEQFFGLVEAQVLEPNEAGRGLLQGIGFEEVDVGRSFRKAM